MDKMIAGLLGAVGAVCTAAPVQAAPLRPTTDAVLHASSYAELLRPVPNALETLRAMDEEEGGVEQVQFRRELRRLVGRDRYHHHHHRFYRRRYYHHHHHRFYR